MADRCSCSAKRRNQPDARMMHTYGQKKKAAKRAIDRVGL